jgi:hypothetical protein
MQRHISKTLLFFYETLRREKEKVSPWWNLWAPCHVHLMHWKRGAIPIETRIVCFTMELCNKSCNEGEVVGPVSIWNRVMKLCIERDAYFISKFHILEIGRWNSPLRPALEWLVVYARQSCNLLLRRQKKICWQALQFTLTDGRDSKQSNQDAWLVKSSCCNNK